MSCKNMTGEAAQPKGRCEQGPRRQRGQTLAIVAVMLVGLVAVLAVVIDLGNAHAQRRLLQNAADAGALAGARVLALDQSQDEVYAAAREYAVDRNTTVRTGEVISCSARIEGPTVTVIVSKTVRTFFASVVGIPTVDVCAVAKAEYSGPRGPSMMPLALRDDTWAPGATVKIYASELEASTPIAGEIGPAQRGWLNLDQGSVDADELKCWVCNCPNDPAAVEIPEGEDGIWVNGTPGIDNSVLLAFADCQKGQDVLVPIFDTACHRGDACFSDVGNGDTNYYIIGFALFHIDDVKDTGNPKYIIGTFVEKHYISTASEGGGRTDYGLRVVRLVR